jgi:putative toxin-antitoxin system antitoxin component (TIGR02293 family)
MSMTLLASQHRRARKTNRTPRRACLAGQGLSLGLTTVPTNELIHLIERGLPFKTLTTLSDKTGIPISELASVLRIPERTLARRRVAGRLAPDESERLMRVATVFEKAVQLFEGEADAAVTWLRSPKKALSNHSPLQYACFEVGAREVENLIGRLEHGIFS